MTSVTAFPRTDRTAKLRDGRSIAFAEWGDLEGMPVFLFHGMPGSRLLCPDEDATRAARVRLITVDRPGYGRSDPRPGRTLLDWADDVHELADLLALPEFPIIGWSSGGPHALACAIRMPARVTTVGLAASPGPTDEVTGAWEDLSPEVRRLIEQLRQDPAAAEAGIADRVQWYADDPESIFDPGWAGPDDPDDELLAHRHVLGPLKQWMREGARQGSTGYVGDWVAENLPWGFSFSDIHQDVCVWWGERDVLVGRAHAEYLASTLPRSRLITYPGEGHLSPPVVHWEEMLANLLRR